MPSRKSLAIVIALSLSAVHLAADCPSTVTVQVPVTACKSGTATASVIGVPGASYAWTIDGGTIVGDATGDHIVLSLGTAAKTVVSVTMTAADCVSHGSGLITLRAPFGVHVAAIPAARANEPLTVSWSYDNGTPAQQTISGDFGTVSLPPAARSYSYTPQTSGNKQFVVDATLAAPPSPPLPRRDSVLSRRVLSPLRPARLHTPRLLMRSMRARSQPSSSTDLPPSSSGRASNSPSVRNRAR